MKILVDFDGTCIFQLPEPGHCGEDTGAGKVLRELQKYHEIYLWTARNHNPKNPYNWINGKLRDIDSLDQALRWFKSEEIELRGVNDMSENLCRSRKIHGDLLIDDISVGIPKIWKNVIYYSYVEDNWKWINTFCVDWEKLWEDHLKALCMGAT
jgi:hypothetical protein